MGLLQQFFKYEGCLRQFFVDFEQDQALASANRKYKPELEKWGALELPEIAKVSLGMLLADLDALLLNLDIRERRRARQGLR